MRLQTRSDLACFLGRGDTDAGGEWFQQPVLRPALTRDVATHRALASIWSGCLRDEGMCAPTGDRGRDLDRVRDKLLEFHRLRAAALLTCARAADGCMLSSSDLR